METETPRKHISKPMCAVIVVVAIAITTATSCALILFVFKAPSQYPTNSPNIHVDSVSLSPFNLCTSQITAKWDFDFSFQNPYTVVWYNLIDVSLLYKRKLLAGALVPPFSQLKMNTTLVHVTFTAISLYVDDKKVMEDMAAEKGNGAVNFNAQMYVQYSFTDGSHTRSKSRMNVFCNDVKVESSSNDSAGKLLGDPMECKTVSW